MNKFTFLVMCIKFNLQHKLHGLVLYPNFSFIYLFMYLFGFLFLISHSASICTSLRASPGLFLAAVCVLDRCTFVWVYNSGPSGLVCKKKKNPA